MSFKPVKVEGVRELQAALRSVDGQTQRQLRVAGNKSVAHLIARARTRATTPMEKAAVASLRAASQQRFAAVRLGSQRVPFALGAEFGANRDERRQRRGPGRPHSYVGYRQFKPHTGREGTFLYPTVRAERDAVVANYLSEVERLLVQAGFL